MNKKEFLSKLRKSLSALSRAERKEQIAFYSEMIPKKVHPQVALYSASVAIYGGIQNHKMKSVNKAITSEKEIEND